MGVNDDTKSGMMKLWASIHPADKVRMLDKLFAFGVGVDVQFSARDLKDRMVLYMRNLTVPWSQYPSGTSGTFSIGNVMDAVLQLANQSVYEAMEPKSDLPDLQLEMEDVLYGLRHAVEHRKTRLAMNSLLGELSQRGSTFLANLNDKELDVLRTRRVFPKDPQHGDADEVLQVLATPPKEDK